MRSSWFLAITLITVLMGGCSTRYALVDDAASSEWAQDQEVGRIEYVCWERVGTGQFHPWNGCPKLQAPVKSGDTKTVVEVRRAAYLRDASPGMIVFLGVIPAENQFEYEITVTTRRTGHSDRIMRRKVHVLETWGSLNTVRNLVDHANKLEEIEMQIFRSIHEKLTSA